MLLSELKWEGERPVAYADIIQGTTIFENGDGTYDIWGDVTWDGLDALAAQAIIFELTKVPHNDHDTIGP